MFILHWLVMLIHKNFICLHSLKQVVQTSILV
jgi:hypothetical protein